MENDDKKIKTFTRKNFKPTVAALVSEHGKLPPQAVDLEEAVLGALMIEKDALTAVIDILRPESFYKESHQRIYSAIQSLFSKSEPIDILTVTNELRQKGELEFAGGAYYITFLTDRVASSAHAEYHARIIAQKYIQRELIRISSEIIKDAYEDTTDVFNLLDKAEQNLFSVAEGNIRKNYDKMSSLIGQAIKQIEIARSQEGGLTGIPSGFSALDRVTSGWQRSDLIILAARPGMGKTAFVLSMARNVAVEFKKPTAVFSLEMSSLQLVNRLIASESELPAEKLKKGHLANHEWEQLNSKIGRLSDAPLFIDDTPALSIFELRAKCRRLKAQHNIGLIIIDYLQLMTTGGDSKGNREQEISTISRSLKSIAKELDVPIIALSQLSRQVETRGGVKRPQLSDLRESGAIEQDADMVMFIYRPEYYGLEQDEQGNSTRGLAELIIAKHRNGSLENIPLRFIASLAKFTDLDFHSSAFGQTPAKINPSGDFDSTSGGNIIIRSSKMNEMDDEAPF
jgi:replicative DNA helicase